MARLGYRVYSATNTLIDVGIPGIPGNAIISYQQEVTTSSDGIVGCVGADLELGRFVELPAMSIVEIYEANDDGANEVIFAGRIKSPPVPKAQRITQINALSKQQERYWTGEDEQPIERDNEMGPIGVDNPLARPEIALFSGMSALNSYVLSEPLQYEILGLKSYCEDFLIYDRSYEQRNISSIVIELAYEISQKANIEVDEALIDEFDYVTPSIEFDADSYKDAFDALAGLAGIVSWGVTPDRKFFFKERSSTVSRAFLLQKDPVELSEPSIDASALVNAVTVEGSGLVGKENKRFRSPPIIDAESIAAYGRIEKNFTYASSISEAGIPKPPLSVLALDPMPSGRPYPKRTENDDEAIVNGTTPLSDFVVPITNTVAIRDLQSRTVAFLQLPTNGTLECYFNPQFATAIIIEQGSSGAVKDSKILTTPTGSLIRTPSGSAIRTPSVVRNTPVRVRLFDGTEQLADVSGTQVSELTIRFPKRAITKLALVVTSPAGTLDWLIKGISIILEGPTDLERYAQNILDASSKPVVSSKLKIFDHEKFVGEGVRLFDLNGYAYDYEVERIKRQVEGGSVTEELEIGRNVINFQRLLVIREQQQQSEAKRSRLLDKALADKITQQGELNE